MNYFMLSAAVVMGVTSAVHIFLGTHEIVAPVMQIDTLHPVIRNVTLVVWHMVTLFLILSATAMFMLVRHANLGLSVFLIALHAGFAAIFLHVNITVFSAIFTLPQRTAFALVAALMGKALRQEKASTA